jgi:hypothetical protein
MLVAHPCIPSSHPSALRPHCAGRKLSCFTPFNGFPFNAADDPAPQAPNNACLAAGRPSRRTPPACRLIARAWTAPPARPKVAASFEHPAAPAPHAEPSKGRNEPVCSSASLHYTLDEYPGLSPPMHIASQANRHNWEPLRRTSARTDGRRAARRGWLMRRLEQ